MSRLQLALGISIISIVAFPAIGRAASFDCSKATYNDEAAVCANPNLSALDDLNAQAYARIVQKFGPSRYKFYAQDFMSSRRQCDAREACLATAYENSIEIYNSLGAAVSIAPFERYLARAGAVPNQPGQCAFTTVLQTGNRIQGSGTSLSLSNGGYQVSYDDLPDILKWQPAEPVMQCLVSLPTDCPAGDTRGKVMTVTNMKRMSSWTAPDSQHDCGGA
jgi:uncharacterized protein